MQVLNLNLDSFRGFESTSSDSQAAGAAAEGLPVPLCTSEVRMKMRLEGLRVPCRPHYWGSVKKLQGWEAELVRWLGRERHLRSKPDD